MTRKAPAWIAAAAVAVAFSCGRGEIFRGDLIREWQADPERVNGVAFTRELGVLLTIGSKRAPRVAAWDMSTGRFLRSHDLGDEGLAVAVSRVGHLAAISAANEKVVIWNWETGHVVRTLDGLAGALAFSPDGKYLAGGAQYLSLTVWEVGTGRVVHTFGGLGHPVAYSPDGRYLIAYRAEPDLTEILDATTFEKVGSVRPPYRFTTAIAVSDDSNILATADSNGRVWLWRIPDGKALRYLGVRVPAYSLAFAEERNRLVIGSAGTIEVWDAVRGRRVATFGVKSDAPPSVDVSRGAVIATAGEGGVVQLWRLP